MKVRALVLRGEPSLAIPAGTVPVTINFDPSRRVGVAMLTRDDDGNVYAEMDLCEDIQGTPAVGSIGAEIVTVGICSSPNVDASIPPIGEI